MRTQQEIPTKPGSIEMTPHVGGLYFEASECLFCLSVASFYLFLVIPFRVKNLTMETNITNHNQDEVMDLTYEEVENEVKSVKFNPIINSVYLLSGI